VSDLATVLACLEDCGADEAAPGYKPALLGKTQGDDQGDDTTRQFRFVTKAALSTASQPFFSAMVYYNQVRTQHRAIQRSGAIVGVPILAGPHHQYVRI
jgi:hypothetical protein